MNGRTVELEQTDLLSLSESECDALQKVALQHINELDLGVQITVPKGIYFELLYLPVILFC